MRTTKQILPGVKEIGWVKSEHLIKNISLRGISMMPVPILSDIHKVLTPYPANLLNSRQYLFRSPHIIFI